MITTIPATSLYPQFQTLQRWGLGVYLFFPDGEPNWYHNDIITVYARAMGITPR